MSQDVKFAFIKLPGNISSGLDIIDEHDQHDVRSKLVPDILERFPFTPEMHSTHPALNIFHVNNVAGKDTISCCDDQYGEQARKKAILRDIEQRVAKRLSRAELAEQEHIDHQLGVSQKFQVAASSKALQHSMRMVDNRRAIVNQVHKAVASNRDNVNSAKSAVSPKHRPNPIIALDHKQIAYAGGMASYSPAILTQIASMDVDKINFSFPGGNPSLKNTQALNAYGAAAVHNLKKVS